MIPALIGAGVAGAGLLGAFDKGDPGAKFNNAAYNEFGNITQPSAEELQYQIQQLQLQGLITPEEADTIMQDPSLLAKITGSPEAKSAQMTALGQLQDIGAQGGMTVGDKATLAEINAANAAKQRGSREALAMNARERGVGGSGVDLVSQMINQQSSAGNENLQGLEVAKQAQQRALEAISQSGQLGGQIESQQFGEEATKAAAADAINKFNAANKQGVEMTNVAARNTAQGQNLAEKQRVSDVNVGLTNQKAAADAATKQQVFENKLKIASGKTGQLSNMAQGARETQAGNEAMSGALVGAGGQILGQALQKKWNPVTGKYE